MLSKYFLSLIFFMYLNNVVHCKPKEAPVVVPLLSPIQPLGIHCGGTINAQSGRISYKRFQLIASGERCVWIIRCENARAVEINVHSNGIPNSLTFTALGHYDQRTDWKPSSYGFTWLEYSNVLVVTLAANTEGTGFEFDFMFSTSGYNEPASVTSEDVLVATDFEILSYPSQTNGGFNPVTEYEDSTTISYPDPEPEFPPYGNNDLSVFVFIPSNNMQVCGTEINVAYKEISVENYFDNLDVLIFDIQNGSWSQLGRITGGDSLERIRWNDLIMLVFRSDSSVVAEGFHLTTTQTSGRVECP